MGPRGCGVVRKRYPVCVVSKADGGTSEGAPAGAAVGTPDGAPVLGRLAGISMPRERAGADNGQGVLSWPRGSGGERLPGSDGKRPRDRDEAAKCQGSQFAVGGDQAGGAVGGDEW